MGDTEKLTDVDGKPLAEPLILRPPVGGDAFKGLGAYNNVTTRRSGICWPRSVVLRMMIISILLACIAGCVLVVFALRHSNPWPWRHTRSREVNGFCYAITPFSGIEIGEDFAIEPTALMASHGSVAGFPAATIFHLLGDDGMTILYSDGACYTYPMTTDVAEAVEADNSMVNRIENTFINYAFIQQSNHRIQVNSPLVSQVFAMSPNTGERVHIRHKIAESMCRDRPIFRLIEMVMERASVTVDPTVTGAPETGCPKDCPAGESRDGGVVRQVCRCHPKNTPPHTFLLPGPSPPAEGEFGVDPAPVLESDGTGGDNAPDDFDTGFDFDDDVDDNDDLEEDDDDEEEEGEVVDTALAKDLARFNEGIADSNAWIPEPDDGEVAARRVRRSIEEIHHIKTPVAVPSDCKVEKQILGAVIPGDAKHNLPLLTIVKC